MNKIIFDVLDSTNDYCKQNDDGKDMVVIAKEQTLGRGTKGRSFISADGGLYLSIMRHFNNFKVQNAFKIMINTAVAVCKTLENYGVNPTIKWPNDVLINGKKISGTLIENTFSGDNISRSIVGIGININNSLSSEIENIATSLSQELSKIFNVEEVIELLLKNLEKDYTLQDYTSKIDWLGKTINVISGEKTLIATAKGVSQDGRLICIVDGKEMAFSSAEVSVRTQYGK